MSITKTAGVLGTLICITIFAAGFGQIQFGYYVPPANIPAIDITAIKWVCAALALMSAWALITIARAPVLGRRR